MDNSVGIDCRGGGGGWEGWRWAKVEKLGQL